MHTSGLTVFFKALLATHHDVLSIGTDVFSLSKGWAWTMPWGFPEVNFMKFGRQPWWLLLKTLPSEAEWERIRTISLGNAWWGSLMELYIDIDYMHDCNEIYVYHINMCIYIYILYLQSQGNHFDSAQFIRSIPKTSQGTAPAPRINTPPRSAESPLAPFPRTALVGCGPPRNGENQQTPFQCCKGCCTRFFCCWPCSLGLCDFVGERMYFRMINLGSSLTWLIVQVKWFRHSKWHQRFEYEPRERIFWAPKDFFKKIFQTMKLYTVHANYHAWLYEIWYKNLFSSSQHVAASFQLKCLQPPENLRLNLKMDHFHVPTMIF